MSLFIHAIGKMGKRDATCDLRDHYKDQAARLIQAQGFGKIIEREYAESSHRDVNSRKKEEAQSVLKSVPKGDYIIALDEFGKNISSREFSSILQDQLTQSISAHFIIGGPDGHGDECLSKAHLKLSLGKMTWPHRLARVMLYEQIYRAMTIMTHHPYHRD